MILGLALEEITGEPLATLLQENILGPLNLANRTSFSTAAIPEPVLHVFTLERREALGIAPSTRFYEESTFWNPSWTLAQGSVQTINICDMTATAIAVGERTLLSPESRQAQVGSHLLGFNAPLEGCPTCHTLNKVYGYELGVVLSGAWILQNSLFAGYGGIEAYLPPKKIAIAVVTT